MIENQGPYSEDTITENTGQGLEDHWASLLRLIDLVGEPKLRKAMRQWVNKNQNCAYSVKSGHCSMNCDSCLNDVTMELIIKGGQNENNLPRVQKPQRKRIKY